jgi:diaminopimelate decarboxylase
MNSKGGKKNSPRAPGTGPTVRLPLDHWGLRVGEQGLQLGSLSIPHIAERQGTPFYLFDEQRLRANARRASDAVTAAGLSAELFYSLKTNPHPRVLEILREEGLGAEVISSRELGAALGVGYETDRIVFNGPGKSDQDLELAVGNGVLIQVESASEAAALARIAESGGKTARTGVRVNPDVFDDTAQNGLRMGRRGSVFGLDPAGPGFREAVRTLDRCAATRLVSLSAHIGTGITITDPFRRLARALVAVQRQLATEGVAIDLLDLGGGFAVPSEVRYGHGAFDSLLPPAEAAETPPPGAIASFADCCSVIADEIPDTGLACLFEPGRLLVSDTFHLVARVLRVKEEAGTSFAVLDAGRVQNALFVGRGFHEIVLVNDPYRPCRRPWTLTGPLCADFDVFASDRLLPDFEEGDLVAVLDVGAYNLSAQSTWSFDPAPVIDVDDVRTRPPGGG